MCVLTSVFLFQNCGEEGFVSSQGIETFESFEAAYPEMDKEGGIVAKFEKSRDFYSVSPEVEREYSIVFRAVASRPAPTPPVSTGRGTGGTGGGTGGVSNDVDQQSPTYIGSDKDYYKDEFNFPAVVAQAGQIKSFQSKIFPARYYGEPRYAQAFGGNGLGIIGINQFLGTTRNKTAATFYQYKLDYLRDKAVVFIVSDGLAGGKLGASTVSAGRADFVNLAKKGYLVVHLQPRFMKSSILADDKCANLGKFFFNGVQEVRRAISDVVSRASYFGIDKNKMFMVGFGEGGTLAAETAFLDNSEAQARFGEALVDVPGFSGKGLFKGIAVSGGGVIDKATVQGPSKARILSIHGGNDRKVSVLGEQIYGCARNAAQKINPAASHFLTNEVSNGASASVLNCGKEKPAEVRPLSTQMGYFATYFHNIILSGGTGIANHYRSCTMQSRDNPSVCTYPLPLISQLVSLYEDQPVGNFYTKGPCTPKPRPNTMRPDNDR